MLTSNFERKKILVFQFLKNCHIHKTRISPKVDLKHKIFRPTSRWPNFKNIKKRRFLPLKTKHINLFSINK